MICWRPSASSSRLAKSVAATTSRHLALNSGRVVVPVVAVARVAIEVVGLGVGDDGEVVVALLEHLGEPLRPLQLGDRDLDADLAELARQHLARALGLADRRQLEARLETVGIAASASSACALAMSNG